MGGGGLFSGSDRQGNGIDLVVGIKIEEGYKYTICGGVKAPK